MKWVGLQALTGMLSRIIQKFIGAASVSLGHTIYVTVVMGLVQMVGGAIIGKARRKPIMMAPKLIFGAMAFGVLALVNSVLSFMTFVPRNGQVGDIGVATFIVTLSIIPGALVDWLYFKHPLRLQQWIGVGIAIFAGYTILGLPSFTEATQLPLWVWLAAFNALGVALNQIISQSIKDIDPWLKNFWVGLATAVTGLLLLPFTLQAGALFKYEHLQTLTVFGILVGIIILPYIFANIMAYKDGSHIAQKKLLWNALWLISTMIFGMIIFHEAITIWKFAGVTLFCVAFILMQKQEVKKTT